MKILKIMNELPYANDFYLDRDQLTRHSAEVMVDFLKNFFQPNSVLDAGCGVGTWLSVFRERGAKEIYGLDGDWVREENLVISADNFQPWNFAKPFDLGRRFDLAMSLEVAEHLPLENADGFVKTLTDHAPIVLFGAAIPMQGGAHHYNEQWPEYWVELFNRHNFVAFDCIRSYLWNCSEVLYWYSQNTLLYVSHERLKEDTELAKKLGNPTKKPARLIHPVLYNYKNDILQNPHKLGVRKLVLSLFPAFKEKLYS